MIRRAAHAFVQGRVLRVPLSGSTADAGPLQAQGSPHSSCVLWAGERGVGLAAVRSRAARREGGGKDRSRAACPPAGRLAANTAGCPQDGIFGARFASAPGTQEGQAWLACPAPASPAWSLAADRPAGMWSEWHGCGRSQGRRACPEHRHLNAVTRLCQRQTLAGASKPWLTASGDHQIEPLCTSTPPHRWFCCVRGHGRQHLWCAAPARAALAPWLLACRDLCGTIAVW